MLDWTYGVGYPEIKKREKVKCKNCSKHRRLDIPYQDFYCKEYNKLIARDHIDDKIECKRYEEKHNVSN